MQQGRSLPRAVLTLGISGLIGVWLLAASATAWAGAMPVGLMRDGALGRLAAVQANAVDGLLADNGAMGASGAGPPSPTAPREAPIDPAIESAVARIEALAETFGRLADTTSDAGERARRAALAQTYAAAAATLRRRAAAGEIRFADLPPGIEAVLDGESVTIGRDLAGRGAPAAPGGATTQLTLALLDLPSAARPTAARGQWARLHEARLADIETQALRALRPYLTRYWYLQDAYLAMGLRQALPALAAGGREADLSAPVLEAAFQELLAEVRATSAVAGDALVEDWSAYRAQLADLSAAALADGTLALDRLFSPVEAPPAAAEAPGSGARLADLQARLAALSETLAVRGRELEETRGRLLALQEDLAALATRGEGQRAAVQALTDRLAAERLALDRARATATARQDEVTRRLAASDALLARQQGALDEVTGTLDAAARDLTALRTRVDALRQAQTDSAEGEAERAAQRAQRLSTLERETRSLTQAAERVEGLAKQQGAISAEIDVLKASSTAQAETLARLDERAAAALALGGELDAARQRLQHLESSARAAEGQRQELAQSLAGLAQGLTAQEALAGTLQSRTTTLADRLDGLANRIGEAAPSTALDAMKRELGALEQRVANHGETLGAATQRLTALGRSIAQYEPRLQVQQSRIASLFDTVGRQAASLSQVERDLTRGLARLDDLDSRLAQKVDRAELAARLTTVQQAAERQMSGAQAQSGRISGLERQTADLDAATGKLSERLSGLEGGTTADLADLRLRVEGIEQRAERTRWAALLALSIAGLSALAALVLVVRLVWRRLAARAVRQPDEARLPGAAGESLPIAAAGPPGGVVPALSDDTIAAYARKADAQKRRLEALDALLAKLAFAIFADREKAASIERDLAAAREAIQAQTAEATNSAAELEALRRETAVLAKQQNGLKVRTKAGYADLAKLAAARQKIRRIDSNVAALRREVRNACWALLAAIESAKSITEAAAEERAAARAEDVPAGGPAKDRKPPIETPQEAHGGPTLRAGLEGGERLLNIEQVESLRGRAIDAIRRANLESFVYEFAKLTALSPSQIGLMLFTGDGRDLAAACRAAGIAEPHFAALFIIARRRSSESRDGLIDDLARAIRYFEMTSKQDAMENLRAWQSVKTNGRSAVRADL